MLPSKIDRREFLKRLPLFADFSPEELAGLAARTQELHVARGMPIFHRGDPCRGFHIVIYGQVKLGFLSAQGDEKIIEIIGPGFSFGEALMFMEKPYIVGATALADTMLLHIAKEAVFDELERQPAFARRMLAGMSRRLHGLIKDVESYSLRSGSQRIVGYLLKDEPEGDGALVTLTVSKKSLASRLNLTPEYFSRVLHDLVELKMISVQGRQITILDIERLRVYEG
ncbi:Crp/Fnr family transcriptional regulator [Massilia sp. CF038]|uniref:Crp/Fnr family transcriptional regulator n=1 Tax=Massilia sp. CF038 TaxID=1881045 RepID=UPI000921DFBE|nr:Crp/Fnr family transcriptional regulator [Massilia sp. CF038]SHG72497.1 cAMP-binding domain of CRP or a regulatory subunit of cAMP-dependent protein kinases [Massilia sp. CF038]